MTEAETTEVPDVFTDAVDHDVELETIRVVALLTCKGSTVRFHSINSQDDVVESHDDVERLMSESRFDVPDGLLASKVFERFASDAVCNFKGDSEGCLED